MAIRIVRLGSPRAPDEGLRVGTVRRPPRGVPKSEYASRDIYDVWFPNVAPSEPLVKEALGAKVSHHLDAVLPGLDAVMALRIQKERLAGDGGPTAGAYAAEYGLDEKRMSLAREHCGLLHPGPVNRGVEVTGRLADSARSLILKQVAGGVFVRMAVLARVARAAANREGGKA